MRKRGNASSMDLWINFKIEKEVRSHRTEEPKKSKLHSVCYGI